MKTRPVALGEDAIREALRSLPGWEFRDGRLRKEFVFADFAAAFGFMAAVALRAERANHHPEWSNVYRKVTIALSTHEAGAVTEKDVSLAREIEALAPAPGGPPAGPARLTPSLPTPSSRAPRACRGSPVSGVRAPRRSAPSSPPPAPPPRPSPPSST